MKNAFILFLSFVSFIASAQDDDGKLAPMTYGIFSTFSLPSESGGDIVPGSGGAAHFRYQLSGSKEDGISVQGCGIAGLGASFGEGASTLNFYLPLSVDIAAGSNGFNSKRFGIGTGLGVVAAYASNNIDGSSFMFGPEYNLNFRVRFLRTDYFIRAGVLYNIVGNGSKIGSGLLLTRTIKPRNGNGSSGGYQSDLRSTRGINLNSWTK